MSRRMIMVVGLLSLVTIAYASIGLGTKFATIVLEKLEPGGVYNITKLRNLPLIVINSGTSETEAAVEVEIPDKAELKEGYQPIPDPTWVKIVPNRFRLKAGEEVRCEVIISIPDDKTLIGKHFQLKIWSHTVGEDAFGAGVVNRMFFSIGTMGPESLRQAKMKQALFSAELDFSPEKMYLTVPIGRRVNVGKELAKSLTLINKGGVDVEVKIESVENKLNFPISEGFRFTPDVKMLKLEKEKMKIKKRRIEDVNFFIHIPDEPKYKDGKFMFLVKVTPIKPELPMEFYSRVFVTVKDD